MKNTIYILLFAIILNGCTSSLPEKVYETEKTYEVSSYFVKGIPIGVLLDDSLIIMAIMNPVSIANTSYVRLWVLYGNKMKNDFLLAPLEFVTMSTIGKRDNLNYIRPESPTIILANIEDEKIISSILTVIGGSLQTLSTQNTKLYDEYKNEKMSIGDKEIRNEYILQKTKEQLLNTAYYYDIFKESINKGILRRNTIFPFNSVNGYIYFPIPDYNEPTEWSMTRRNFGEEVNKIIFKFKTPIGLKTLEFKPIAGE